MNWWRIRAYQNWKFTEGKKSVRIHRVNHSPVQYAHAVCAAAANTAPAQASSLPHPLLTVAAAATTEPIWPHITLSHASAHFLFVLRRLALNLSVDFGQSEPLVILC